MASLARAAMATLAFLTLSTPVAPPPPPGPGSSGTARLFAAPVPLNPDRPADRALGRLRYLGGWVLSSDDRRFGAISAMVIEGDRVLALSDNGTLFRFAVPGAGGSEVEILPLVEGPGVRESKIDRDSESMILADGQLWIGYENSNELWRYRAADGTATARAAPPAMKDWPANRGAEAMVRLADGRFLVIAEETDDDGASLAALLDSDPASAAAPAPLYRAPSGHRITDAALLPNGRLILLARGFTVRGGWSAKLLTADLPRQSGETIQTLEVATFAAPLTRDNMEALSVSTEQGRTIVWIASDDNLNPLQRTLLLKFELIE